MGVIPLEGYIIETTSYACHLQSPLVFLIHPQQCFTSIILPFKNVNETKGVALSINHSVIKYWFVTNNYPGHSLKECRNFPLNLFHKLRLFFKIFIFSP